VKYCANIYRPWRKAFESNQSSNDKIMLRGSSLQQQERRGPFRLVLKHGKKVARPPTALAMNSLTSSTSEANADPADMSPSGIQSRTRLTYAERRFASVVLPYLADAHALARWLVGSLAHRQLRRLARRGTRRLRTSAAGNR
jgi:hypothetical protein